MSFQFSNSGVEKNHLQIALSHLAFDVSPGVDPGRKYRWVMANRFLATIASGARVCLKRVLAALHESRRKQGAIELARYRHLIYDPTTGVHFGTSRLPHSGFGPFSRE